LIYFYYFLASFYFTLLDLQVLFMYYVFTHNIYHSPFLRFFKSEQKEFKTEINNTFPFFFFLVLYYSLYFRPLVLPFIYLFIFIYFWVLYFPSLIIASKYTNNFWPLDFYPISELKHFNDLVFSRFLAPLKAKHTNKPIIFFLSWYRYLGHK